MDKRGQEWARMDKKAMNRAFDLTVAKRNVID